MKTTTRLSTIALCAALIAAPASAVSINLNGDGPLVDLGNGNNADSTISVDTGNLLGAGDGDSGASSGAIIDLDLDGAGGGTGNLLDLGGAGGSAGLLDLDTGAGGLLALGDAGTLIEFDDDSPLLDLTGSDDIDGTVDIALGDGDVDPGTTGGIDGVVALGGTSTGNLLDLGSGEDDITADLDGTHVVADVDLEDNGDPAAQLRINSRRGLAPVNGLISIGGDDSVASISLGGDDDAAGGDGSGGGNGPGANPGAGSGSGSAAATPRIASITASGTGKACLNLSGSQLEKLVTRETYDWSTFRSWAATRSLKLVEVDLCDDSAGVALAAEAGNIGRLRAFLAGQAKIRAGLQQAGYTAADVIAADDQGTTLVVYVMKG